MHPLVRPKGGGIWLHAGCGMKKAKVPDIFKGWKKEIRLDADKRVSPDVTASITSMPKVKTASVDAVYCCHVLEHIYPFEVPLALKEFRRVIKPSGFVVIQVPDLQALGKELSKGNLYNTIYTVPGVEPIAPIDLIYGYRWSLARGNTYMQHKTGFTASVLASALHMCGFGSFATYRANWNLWGFGFWRKLKDSELAKMRQLRVF